MTGVVATIPRIQFSNPLGIPLAGGQLYTYLAGTTTPASTFQDETLTVENTNPVELDSTGSCVLWLDPEKRYKFVLKNALGVTQPGWPVDNISGAGGMGSLESTFSLYARLSALGQSSGAGLLGFNDQITYPPGTLGRTLASTLKGEEGKVYQAFGYVVRNDGNGWVYIDDLDHRPTNMSTVSVVGDSLRVNYSFTGVRVLTHIVGADETMSALGITCGPSVGLSFSDIRMYMPFACWVEFIGGAWRFGTDDGINPWFGPGTDTTIATSADGAQFTITHKTASGSHPPTFAVLTQAAADAPGTDVRMSYGGTSIIGTAHAQFEGYVYWVGPGVNDWAVSTPNISKPTFSFSDGVLTVAHENLGADTKAVSVDAVSGVYLPATGSNVTGQSFQVVFQDYAGVNVATPNTNMKFRYMRPRSVKSKATEGMRVAVQRGPVQLNPDKVTSVNGNFWGFGLLETK